MVDLVGALIWRTHRLGTYFKQRLDNERAWVRWLVDAFLLPSDIWKIKIPYKRVHGYYPRIIRPRSFNDYIHHSKIFRRNALMTKLADKIEVRNYVKERVGEEYLTQLYWTGDDLADVDLESLPNAFVIKSNNGSGTNIIVKDKNAVDWGEALTKSQKWMKKNHSVGSAEWQYRWIKPSLLIEEFLDAGGGSVPSDFKFFCFRGKPEFLQVDFSRFSDHRRNFYDLDFKFLDFELKYPRSDMPVEIPHNLNEMIHVAEKLCAGLEFARVDLYPQPKLIFGEITLTPEAGNGLFRPVETDREIYSKFLAPKHT